SLAEQVAKLKRRVTLRVGANTATLEDGEVDRIVDAVVSKLSQAFEVVPEDAAKPTSSSKPASSTKPASSAERKPAPAPERKRAPSSERKPEPSAPPSRKRTAKASH